MNGKRHAIISAQGQSRILAPECRSQLCTERPGVTHHGVVPGIGVIAHALRGRSGRALDRSDRIRGVSDSPLEALIQEQLASVVFVMDYLQLDSGDARFTAYVWPAVTIGGATLGIGDPGYRDALCAFITQEVMSTEESAEAGLVVRFGLGEVVTNPEPTDLSGPEIAQVQLHEGPFRDAAWTVWRPGEGVFARREWS